MAVAWLGIQQKEKELKAQAKDLAKALSEVEDEIRTVREKGTSKVSEDEVIYQRVKSLPFGTHPLFRTTDKTGMKTYLTILAGLALLDKDSGLFQDRLVLLQYLLIQSGLSMALSELITRAMDMKELDFQQMKDMPLQMNHYLIVDAMVMAHIRGTAGEKELRYVADLCALLKESKEQIQRDAVVAAIILQSKSDISVLSAETRKDVYAQDLRTSMAATWTGIQQKEKELKAQAEVLAKSLSEVEGEIRSIQKGISKISKDKFIRQRTQWLPFGTHPLFGVTDEMGKEAYLTILAGLALLDKEPGLFQDRLVLLQYLLTQSSLPMALSELITRAMNMKELDFQQMKDMPPQMNRYLIVDAMVMAHIRGITGEKELRYVADLCTFLKESKEQIQRNAVMAVTILQQKANTSVLFSGKRREAEKRREDYAKDLKLWDFYLPDRLIVSGRKRWEAHVYDEVSFQWKISHYRAHVRKGEVLATYGSRYKWEVKAGRSGTVFCFGEGNSYCIVVSDWYDSVEDIEKWVDSNIFCH